MVCCFGVGLAVDRAVISSHPVAQPMPPSLALVRAELLARYVRPLDASALAAPTIPALLAQLDDRYTVYLGPNQYRTLLDRVEATRVGVGLSLERDASRGLKVLQAFE